MGQPVEVRVFSTAPFNPMGLITLNLLRRVCGPAFKTPHNLCIDLRRCSRQARGSVSNGVSRYRLLPLLWQARLPSLQRLPVLAFPYLIRASSRPADDMSSAIRGIIKRSRKRAHSWRDTIVTAERTRPSRYTCVGDASAYLSA